MKKTVFFLALVTMLVLGMASIAMAGTIDPAQITVGPSVTTTAAVGASDVSGVTEIRATVMPLVLLTVPEYVDFGSVYPEDTGSKAFDVRVRSTELYDLTVDYAASNLLGAAISGSLPTNAAAGDATYGQTVSINVPWGPSGAKAVPVTYTVVF